MAKQKKLAARLYDAIFPSGNRHTRRYAAARRTRMNADWDSSSRTQNYLLRQDLLALRGRAREAARNNGTFKKCLTLVRSNVIGPKGIQLQSQARSMDGKMLNIELNKRVEEAWWNWGFKENCTLSGKLDWVEVQRLAVTDLVQDGEFLIQMYKADNPFGFALKVWNVDYLDETYNDVLPTNGNRVIMSVEIDDNGREVAYWLTTPASDINFTKRRERTRTRVDASEMIHGKRILDDEAQVRGVTWFHAAMLEGKNLESYKGSVMDSARYQTHVMFNLERETPEEEQFEGEEDENGNTKQTVIDTKRMAVNILNPGEKMTQLAPNQPTQNYEAFVTKLESSIATALDLPYFELAGDLAAVNYSSARVGLDGSRENWKALQDFVATNLCRVVFHAWLPQAILSGQLTLTPAEFKEVQNPVWRGRGWKYLDPLKEVNADIARINAKLATRRQIFAEQGMDYSDFLKEWKAEQDEAASLGIDLSIPVAAKPGNSAAPDDNADEKPPAKKGDDSENESVN